MLNAPQPAVNPEIRARQTALLYRNVGVAQIINVVVSGMIAYIGYISRPGPVIVLWWLAVVAVSLVRVWSGTRSAFTRSSCWAAARWRCCSRPSRRSTGYSAGWAWPSSSPCFSSSEMAPRASGAGLLNVIDDILDFSSIEAGLLTLRIAVADTGVGIDEDQREEIFEAFTQADDSMTRKYSGTGLGLAIGRQLAKLMGGRIWLDSEPGRGSVFYVTVRLAKAVT